MTQPKVGQGVARARGRTPGRVRDELVEMDGAGKWTSGGESGAELDMVSYSETSPPPANEAGRNCGW